jgi:EmrB/QacA subfamily drug resistance transporter
VPNEQVESSSASTGVSASGAVLGILAAAMFVYVIDTTIMNVSISALVEDLDTTVSGVQMAITLYTLTMAAFMLTGGKLGDIWGSKKAFRIGLVVYGIGTIMTAVAPNLLVLIVGWSFLEGLGSALIVPAINTLVRANFSGPKRATAYGILFGVASAGAAFGPLIGGWLTTELSWRVAFAAEAMIVVAVLLASRLLNDAPAIKPTPVLDVRGVVLSAAGLAMVVFGILQTSTRGWGDALVITMVVAGLVTLGLFWWWVRRGERRGEPVLMHPSIFRNRAISAGLPILSAQTFAQAGLLFLVPLFTQSVLGFNAFETGLTLLPLSVGVLATSTLTPPLGKKVSPRTLIQVGLVGLFVGGYLLASALSGDASGWDLAPGLFVGGIFIGLIAGQLPNLILSGVHQSEASEASGLQGTAQNLGMALGTAVIGTVILTIAAASVESRVESSDVLPAELKVDVVTALERPFDEANADLLKEAVAVAPPEAQAELEELYADGTIRGFQGAIVVGGLVALLGALLAVRLPSTKLGEGQRDHADDTTGDSYETVKQIVRNPTIAKLQLEMDDLEPSRIPDAGY